MSTSQILILESSPRVEGVRDILILESSTRVEGVRDKLLDLGGDIGGCGNGSIIKGEWFWCIICAIVICNFKNIKERIL